MNPPLSRKHLTTGHAWVILLFAVIVFPFLWQWRTAFLWGRAAGPYRFFAALEWVVLASAGIVFFLFVGVLFAGLRDLIRRKKERSRWGMALLLLLAGLLLTAASLSAIITPVRPLDSVHVDGKTYHLAALGALMDVNYGLFECRAAGLTCKQVYRSGDFSPLSGPRGQILYDDASGTLSIEIAGQGVINEYQP
ncbi:MAG: hypothetical protein D6770_00660 [Anaerolineae bacterium]|nr:MAG: hypothetical protein D6770_00660 [Anaerolineae bacterium]